MSSQVPLWTSGVCSGPVLAYLGSCSVDWAHLACTSRRASEVCQRVLRKAVRARGLFAHSVNWDHPAFGMQSVRRLRFWEWHLLSGTNLPVDGSAEFAYTRPDRALSMDGQEGEIQRDLNRTFPTHPLFSEPGGSGQLALGRILFAFRRFLALGTPKE